MRAFTISLVGLLVALTATHIRFCDGNSNVLCVESEREALLKFKQDLIDHSNRLSSWVECEDCCEWVGVFCNNLTGHVNQLNLGFLAPRSDVGLLESNAEWDLSKLAGKINPSLRDLKHLSVLDLSYNAFEGEIPGFIGSLKSLTYLNLSWANFQGEIPHKLGNLSKLQYLDLADSELETKTLQWVSGLSSLRYLDLSWANLSKATDWLQVTSRLPSLVELHLSECNLNNDSSPISVNYTSLAVLDLSRNWRFSSVPTWIFSLPSLVSIDLSYNSIEGVIPSGFQNMSSLKFLDLGSNSFSSASIPSWFSNLTQLQFLGLSGVGLQGNFSRVIGNLSSLTHLDLSYNQLEIIEPKCFESLCNLRELDLSHNRFDHEVSEIIESLSRLGQLESSLKVLDVSFNRLNGSLPQSLGQLGNLEYLDVSNNMLEGNISEMLFTNLTRLRIFRASGNMLTFKPNPSWIPPFQCEDIRLGNWPLGPQFPQWLQFQKNLSVLDISDAGISGVIPTWFWNLSIELKYVNFSHNQFMGGISYLPVTFLLDLSSNKFTGPLPQVSSNLAFLFLSKNLFSGPLSNLLCNFSTRLDLNILDIESNLLSGEIPDCWENLGSLGLLNLGNNNLTGKIPTSMGSMTKGGIRSLNLRNNSLFGEIPSALQHLAYMRMLDLSENQFTGNIPAWIGHSLSQLVVLNLRSNNFQAHVPDQICALSYLQVLDLGYNNISGAIPKCLSNLSAMATKPRNQIVSGWVFDTDSMFILNELLVIKGRKDEYSTTLGLVTSIDLSVNSLIGEIPEEFGNLTWLRSLNLSGNLLTGKIPDNIGNMEWLESLDLSMNRLHGEIPSSLSNLNFLNHLNLSYNNLTGQIPTGTQLQSFDRFSYIGNHLCGPPITKNCSRNGVANGSSSKGRKGFRVNWLYVSIVLGYVMGFWGVVAPLFFIRSWRIAYYRKLEHIGEKIYVYWSTIAM